MNREVLEVETTGPALLLLTENFYPAWRARVDAEPTPILRADLTFRAVPVPSGKHEVELVYRSGLFAGSLAISAAAAALALAVALIPWVRRRLGPRPRGEQGA